MNLNSDMNNITFSASDDSPDEITNELLVSTIIYYTMAFIIIVLSLIFINNKI
jgi:hypothetical protein